MKIYTRKNTSGILLFLLACFMLPVMAGAQTGVLDGSFGSGGIVKTDVAGRNDYGFATAIQDDGKIIAAGIAHVDSLHNDFGVFRYRSDGSRDSSFGINGIAATDIGIKSDDQARSVCLQKDGKIIVAGSTASGSAAYDFALVRYKTDGSLDSTFGGDGIVTTDIAGANDFGASARLQRDGKIVITGYSSNGTTAGLATVRYNTDGSLDPSFGTGGMVTLHVSPIYPEGQALGIQDDGKIVAVATTVRTIAGIKHYDFLLQRYNTDGSADKSFGTDGLVITDVCYTDYALSVAIQKDGRILVAGSSTDTVTTLAGQAFALVRYNTDGSLDNTFGIGGKVITKVTTQGDKAFGIAIQSNGKIIAVGHAADGVTDFKIVLVCYNTDGSLDGTFGAGGTVITNMATEHEFGESVAIQKDGKIVITGFVKDYFTITGFDLFVARYTGDIPLAIEEEQIRGAVISLAPNPFSTTTILYATVPLDGATLTLCNMWGQKVKELKQLSGQSVTINRDHLPCGHYLLYVNRNNQLLAKEKIVITDH